MKFLDDNRLALLKNSVCSALSATTKSALLVSGVLVQFLWKKKKTEKTRKQLFSTCPTVESDEEPTNDYNPFVTTKTSSSFPP